MKGKENERSRLLLYEITIGIMQVERRWKGTSEKERVPIQ